MTALEDRRQMAAWIDEAHTAGARLAPACKLLGINLRTLQRWRDGDGLDSGDRRPQAERPTPAHALSPEERAEILRIANAPQFAELPPAQIVPRLADEGRYVASESSFHRVLRDHDQSSRRGRAKPPEARHTPTTHTASAPGEVWCWDVTWLPSTVAGRWFYLYVILDLFSRKIIAHEVHEADKADHAAELVKRAALAEGIHAAISRPVLHGDNGASLKATTVLAMLRWLKIAPSYSRPRVSDDNAYIESLFRTVKYRPGFPTSGFADLDAARQWAASLVEWYNDKHRHSGLRFVTPAQRHAGQDRPILQARHAVYEAARERNPRRWSLKKTRNWTPIGPVALNPEREAVAAAKSRSDQHQQSNQEAA